MSLEEELRRAGDARQILEAPIFIEARRWRSLIGWRVGTTRIVAIPCSDTVRRLTMNAML
jgi:hypothetical protein